MRRATAAAGLLVLLTALPLAGVAGPSFALPSRLSAAGATGPNPLAIPEVIVPGGPSVELTASDAAVAEAYSGVALIEFRGQCSGVLVRQRTGPIPEDAPAFLLTNGHCVGAFDPTGVTRDERVDPAEMASVWFGYGPEVYQSDPVGIVAVPWATMKGTDLAILELATTLPDLVAAGHRPYPIASSGPQVGQEVVVVGGPAPLQGARVLRLSACALGRPTDLLESQWTMFGFPANHCQDIRPGSSGSPVLDPVTGALVGLINTGTDGSSGLPDCALNRPCEIGPDGARSRENTNYGPPLFDLSGCFDDTWRYTGPGEGCPLDPGEQLEVPTWSQVANPDAVPPLGGDPRTTWDARLEPTPPSLVWYRVATGPAGGIDCHAESAYGDPISLAVEPVFDGPLPTTEGHHLACILAGPAAEPGPAWQSLDHPTVLNTWIDLTPPASNIELSVIEAPDAWLVEPVFEPPELSLFTWKWGPARSMDCADATGYAAYRRFPVELPRVEAPTRLCVIGYDAADNASAPLDRVFE
jgi:hypothetical protein